MYVFFFCQQFGHKCGTKCFALVTGDSILTISGCDAIPTTRLKSPKITCLLSVPFPEENVGHQHQKSSMMMKQDHHQKSKMMKHNCRLLPANCRLTPSFSTAKDKPHNELPLIEADRLTFTHAIQAGFSGDGG